MLSSHWKEIQSAVHHFEIYYLEEGVNGKWRSNTPSCGTRNPSLLKHLPLHPDNGNIHELYVRLYLLLEDGEEEETHIPDLRRCFTSTCTADFQSSFFPFSSLTLLVVKVCAVGALVVFPSPLPQIKMVPCLICEEPSQTLLLCLSPRIQTGWKSHQEIEPGLVWCLVLG